MKTKHNLSILNTFRSIVMVVVASLLLSANSLFSQTITLYTSGFEDAIGNYALSTASTNSVTVLSSGGRTASKCAGLVSGGDGSGFICPTSTFTLTACKQYSLTFYAKVVTCYGGVVRAVKAASTSYTDMNNASGSDILIDLTLASPNAAYTAYNATWVQTTTEVVNLGVYIEVSGASGPCGSENAIVDDVTLTETTLGTVAGGTSSASPTSVACGGTTTLSLTGQTGYIQWQISIDGGTTYVDVDGENSSTFIPPNLNYTTSFRAKMQGASCTVAYSSVSTVSVTGTSSATWLTTGTNAWGTASNWSPAAVPTACTDVTIPSGGTQPTISAAAVCRSLTVNSSATLTINSTLSIYGNLTNNGNMNDANASGYIDLYGSNGTWGGTGTYLNGATQTGKVRVRNNALYTLTGDPTVSVMNSSGLSTNGELYYSNRTLTVTTTWYCTFYNFLQTGTLRIKGGGSVNTAKSDYGTGNLWIDYQGTSTFGFNLEDDYYNVWFNSNGGGAVGFGSSAKDVTVKNNFWIKGGTTTVVDMTGSGNNGLKIGGDFTNDGAGSTSFLAQTCMVWMNGTKAQTIGGTGITTFNKLRIDNSTAGGVTLTQDARCSGANTGGANNNDPYKNLGGLDLKQGALFLNSKRFTVLNTSTVAITRTSGYVVSETNSGTNTSFLEWDMTASNTGAHVYPFGVSGNYIPFTFNKTSTANLSNISISTRATSASDNTPWAGTSNVAAVSSMMSSSAYYADASAPSVIDRWWDIQASAAVTSNLTFSYQGSENTTSLAPTGTMQAQHWNGTGWDAPVGSGTGVTSGVGTVSVTGASTFSPWVITSAAAPLPIELTSFTATCSDKNVVVKWITASETNTSTFAVERSVDGIGYYSVGMVNAAGTTAQVHNYVITDYNPIAGVKTYYRLKETDIFGKSKYYQVVISDCDSNLSSTVTTYNNQQGNIVITLNTEANNTYVATLYDVVGNKVINEQFTAEKGSNNFKLNISNLNSGVYFISIENGEKRTTQKIFINN